MSDVKYMVIPELAGCQVRLTDGTVVVFTDEDGNGALVVAKPLPTKPRSSPNRARRYR